MTTMVVLIVGLLIGSFLNVCIYRIPRKKSINWPPSHCPNCDTRLKPVDLVPVLSYLFLLGRCRSCHCKISWAYPIVEALNGALYVMVYSVYGLTTLSVIYMLVVSIMLVISKIDLETQTIPDELNLMIFIMGMSSFFINSSPSHLLNQISGLAFGGGFFLGLAILSNGAMGGGDIKMMAALGWLVGWKGIIQVILGSFVLGACVSLILMLFKIKGHKDALPFGPFIAFSAVLYLLWGDALFHFYLQLISGL